MAVGHREGSYQEGTSLLHQTGGVHLHVVGVLYAVAAQLYKFLDGFIAAQVGRYPLTGGMGHLHHCGDLLVGHLLIGHSLVGAGGAAGKADFDELGALGDLRPGGGTELVGAVIHGRDVVIPSVAADSDVQGAAGYNPGGGNHLVLHCVTDGVVNIIRAAGGTDGGNAAV